MIQKPFQSTQDNPRWIIAKRIYQALHIITDAQKGGERHDYESMLRLLRVHEIKAEQARYVLDLLVFSGAVKKENKSNGYILLDEDSDVVRKLNESYARGELVYLDKSVPAK